MHYTQVGVCVCVCVCIDVGLIHALHAGRGVCVLCVCRWRSDSCIIHR